MMHQRSLILEATLKKMFHVAPIGVIQFTDYATDILVILKFFELDKQAYGWVGVGFVTASIAASWLWILLQKDKFQTHVTWLAVILAPLNLHVLYVGSTCAAMQGESSSLEAAVMESEEGREAWKKVKSAERLLHQMVSAGDASDIRYAREALEAALEQASSIPACMKATSQQKQCDELYELFTVLKAFESALESFPLAILASGQVFLDDTEGQDTLMLVSSLILSVLSMTYGFYCTAIEVQKRDAEQDKRQDPTIGRHGQLFVCMLVDVSWTTMAVGMCLGTQALEPTNNFLAFLPTMTQWIILFGRVVPTERNMIPIWFAHNFPVLLLASLPFAVLFTPTDSYLLEVSSGDIAVDGWQFFVMPFARRISLLVIAAFAVSADAETGRVCLLCFGFLLDSVASWWSWRAVTGVGRRRGAKVASAKPNRQGKGESKRERDGRTASSDGSRKEKSQDLDWHEQRVGQLDRTEDLSTDYLSAVAHHARKALERSREQDSAAAQIPATLQELQAVAERLVSQVPTLSPGQRDSIQAAIKGYMPSEDGTTERDLVGQLSNVNEGSIAFNEASSQGPSSWVHPMHVAWLLHGLEAGVWTTVPSFFGTKAQGTAFHMSFEAPRCTYFISHAWKDGGRRKVAMLREFLCLQVLAGRVFALTLLLTAFWVPLGLALEAQFDKFPWWLPSSSVLTGLAGFIVWIVLSTHELLPVQYVPWALSPITIWIDKLCIDQSSPETQQAGVESFPLVLANCDSMVALISQSYFSRLWCVYELAIFAKNKQDSLLLFSIDWPTSAYPFKQARLSPEERAMLTQFSCREAECFVPRDRVTVMRAIREQFGSEDQFDVFVRSELLGVLERSKQRYQSQLTTVFMDAVDLAFGG